MPNSREQANDKGVYFSLSLRWWDRRITKRYADINIYNFIYWKRCRILTWLTRKVKLDSK